MMQSIRFSGVFVGKTYSDQDNEGRPNVGIDLVLTDQDKADFSNLGLDLSQDGALELVAQPGLTSYNATEKDFVLKLYESDKFKDQGGLGYVSDYREVDNQPLFERVARLIHELPDFVPEKVKLGLTQALLRTAQKYNLSITENCFPPSPERGFISYDGPRQG